MAEVELSQIQKIYGGPVTAVADLSLRAAEGELLVLVGPSGSGKTTTLRLIAGLETPTAGTVHIGGRDVTRLPPYRRDVALVFQRPALYPNRTVRDNLLFGLKLREQSWGARLRRWLGRGVDAHADPAARLAEVSRLLGLEDVLDRRPGQLSGGQQQRVALGRALVRRPAAFLLDEPLAHLDPRLRWEMRRELHLLQRRLRATMIHVTHDQDEAMALGDRVAVLDRGRLHQVDRPAVLYERPADVIVAGFLGSPPINLLDGRLDGDDGGLYFRAGGWRLRVPDACRETWQGFTGRTLTLGLRPEHLGPAREGEARLPTEVALVERLGPVSLVTLAHGAVSLTARWEGDPPAEGETVAVAPALEQAHLFDPSGRALAHGRVAAAPAG
jgi:multiple sugar transport system ATP-binding protein